MRATDTAIPPLTSNPIPVFRHQVDYTSEPIKRTAIQLDTVQYAQPSGLWIATFRSFGIRPKIQLTMRRSIIGILLSIVTFSFGFGIASIRWWSATDVPAPPQLIECPEAVAQTSQAEVSKPVEPTTPDFVAQITDLAEFADQGC